MEIKTTKSGLQYYRDFDNMDGGIVMVNPKTIDKYKELKDKQPNTEELGIFFAFSVEQFKEGYNKLIERGIISAGDKVCSAGLGAYGTREAFDKHFANIKQKDNEISKICDAQEVYFYEFNNHECMFGCDGDKPAIEIIYSIFGKEIAKHIVRFNEYMTT